MTEWETVHSVFCLQQLWRLTGGDTGPDRQASDWLEGRASLLLTVFSHLSDTDEICSQRFVWWAELMFTVCVVAGSVKSLSSGPFPSLLQ